MHFSAALPFAFLALSAVARPLPASAEDDAELWTRDAAADVWARDAIASLLARGDFTVEDVPMIVRAYANGPLAVRSPSKKLMYTPGWPDEQDKKKQEEEKKKKEQKEQQQKEQKEAATKAAKAAKEAAVKAVKAVKAAKAAQQPEDEQRLLDDYS
ncbi:hypothetical protein EVJ58_g9298 [Rhodofomes roseus]|uniref:Uncharacterized protein n=1 Tax=Rhodofomes roseus TaxID=34475 RepID=A0A4Y9XTX1_9APHY|nr:hypothetical protein EVJ58_g9298 [Rhodofomes roseus]